MPLRITLLAGLTILCLPLVAAGPAKLNVEFFIVDGSNRWAAIASATVTVSYTGGTQVGDVEGPNPHARFTVPKTVDVLDVTVSSPGYIELEVSVPLDGSPRVGGHGVWLAIYPAIPVDIQHVTR